MYKNKKIIVILPAYNAELTLERTYSEIPFDFVDGFNDYQKMDKNMKKLTIFIDKNS
jgi:hypothetical protein